jgi:CRP-like cAMP-binding protein
MMKFQNRLLGALPRALVEEIGPRLHARRLALGQVLFASNDRINSIYFPESGAVSLISELAGGERIESAMLGRDGVVGGGAVLAHRTAMHQALVQVEGNGHSLDVDLARQIARESEAFRTAIARHEQLVLAQAQQSAACNAKHDLHQRLARWLLRVRDVTEQDSFNLTQEFMAEMLGVRRTSVTLVAKALQDAGLIGYRRGRVTILKPEVLQQTACECHGTIKMRYQAALPAPQVDKGELAT